jgi:hypothetical protein
MRRTLSILLFALAFTVIGAGLSPAGANPTFLCPPIPVAAGDTCECEFFNYAFFPKTVSIQLFSALDGPASHCSDVVVPPQHGTECAVEFSGQDDCACSIQVSRSGGKVNARASINVLNPSSPPRPWDGRACS